MNLFFAGKPTHSLPASKSVKHNPPSEGCAGTPAGWGLLLKLNSKPQVDRRPPPAERSRPAFFGWASAPPSGCWGNCRASSFGHDPISHKPESYFLILRKISRIIEEQNFIIHRLLLDQDQRTRALVFGSKSLAVEQTAPPLGLGFIRNGELESEHTGNMTSWCQGQCQESRWDSPFSSHFLAQSSPAGASWPGSPVGCFLTVHSPSAQSGFLWLYACV